MVHKTLKELIVNIGWTQAQFADHYFENILNINNSATDEEWQQFREKFKKQMQRSTTSKHTIHGYITYLEKTNEFIKIMGIKTMCLSDGMLPPELEKEMKAVSKTIQV